MATAGGNRRRRLRRPRVHECGFAEAGLAITGIVAADEDDWDRYESLHWRALEEWLAMHPEAHEIATRHARYRNDYLSFKRALMGWAIFVGRRPST